MRTEDRTQIEQLRALARLDNSEIVRQELEGVRAEDIAEGIQRLDLDEALALLNHLDEATAAEVMVELPTETAKRLFDELPDTTLAHYLDILPMDDALDLREELPAERFMALLEVIPREDAEEILRLMSYPEGSAGQLMTEDFLAVRPETPVGDIIRTIREAPEDQYETVNDIYVLDERQRLVGVFSLRQAIRAREDQPASEVMREDVIHAAADQPGETVAREIARYGFYAMPIVDYRGRMVGIFTVDDAQEVLAEADTEDVLKLGGVSGDAESYLSLGVFQIARRRVPWLFILFIAETFTGAVLRYYGEGDDGLPLSPLTFFIPLLIGAGGNAGSQTTTTLTRALAVGEVKPSDFLLVMRREFLTALMVGSVLGLAGFVRAELWGTPWELSVVVGIALPVIVLWATTVGSVLPLAAKRLGVDPAVMSAPFITTFVDATGLIIYFEIARRMIPPGVL
jgi:magnesium transporter